MSHAQLHDEYTFFVSPSKFKKGQFLLRYSVKTPSFFAKKTKALINYVKPLCLDIAESRKMALKYAKQFASNNPNYVVEFDIEVMDAGNTQLTFGKYKGRTLNELYSINPAYVQWIAESMTPRNFEMQKIVRQCKIWTYRLGGVAKVG
ncbi:MAG: hypothetical protein HAW67_04775 [Endozoicomonadaceae bacterium]|nr:hypothetical protein [Endozoicomonadaceae bacterium]